MKKVCILGGAFNPPTAGHIGVAEFILGCRSTVDEAWLCPCFMHRFNKEMVSPEHRLEMCRLATRHNPRLKVFDYEIKHQMSGKAYDLVKALLDSVVMRHSYQFTMAIGEDNAETIQKWADWEKLTGMIPFIVVERFGCARAAACDEDKWYWHGPHVYLEHHGRIPETSSTAVREALLLRSKGEYQGRVLDNLNPAVLEYIDSNGLYTANPKELI